MTPFLVLTVFLTITQDATVKQKRALAIKVTVSVIIRKTAIRSLLSVNLAAIKYTKYKIKPIKRPSIGKYLIDFPKSFSL